jgi:hypothetical protein
MWFDTQDLSTLEYLYDLRWIRASSDKGSTAMVSERDEEFPSNLTSAHDLFAAKTLATKPSSPASQPSFTIQSKGGTSLQNSGTDSRILQAISSIKTSLYFSDRD